MSKYNKQLANDMKAMYQQSSIPNISLLEKRLMSLDEALTKAGYISSAIADMYDDRNIPFKHIKEYKKWYNFQLKLGELHELVINLRQ